MHNRANSRVQIQINKKLLEIKPPGEHGLVQAGSAYGESAMEDADKLLSFFFSWEGFSLVFPRPNRETAVTGTIKTCREQLL